MVITTAQLHSTKPELRFCAGSTPARGVSEIRDGVYFWQLSRLEIRLNIFRWLTIPQKQFIIIFIIGYGIYHFLSKKFISRNVFSIYAGNCRKLLWKMICRVWDSGTTDSFLNQISSDLYSCNTCSKYLYTSFIISLQQFSLLLNLFLQKNVVFSMIFKACVRYYHQIFIFPPNDSPSKTMKNAFYFI